MNVIGEIVCIIFPASINVSLFGTLKYKFRCKQVFSLSFKVVNFFIRLKQKIRRANLSNSLSLIIWSDFSCHRLNWRLQLSPSTSLPQQFKKYIYRILIITMCFGPGCSSVGWKEEPLRLHTLDLRLMPSSFDHKQTWNLAHESLRRRRTTWGVTPCAYLVHTTLNFFFFVST